MDTDNTNDSPEGPAEPKQVDYFGGEITKRVTLGDGQTYVDIRELTEGDRRKFLATTTKPIKVDRATGDAQIRMAMGEERAELLRLSIVGWNLVKKNAEGVLQPFSFSKQHLDQWISSGRPSAFDPIEEAIRELNPWLTPADMTVDDIDEQIEKLKEQREKLEERDAGNDS